MCLFLGPGGRNLEGWAASIHHQHMAAFLHFDWAGKESWGGSSLNEWQRAPTGEQSGTTTLVCYGKTQKGLGLQVGDVIACQHLISRKRDTG